MKDAKFIFITGGVSSSLGKGVAAASITALLEARGFKVNIVKIDPYVNMDAGSMSPYQHGEIFVTDDGAEADLDFGNYERFTTIELTKDNSITTGKVYQEVITKERNGLYNGYCVQVIPHITDEVKRRIRLTEKENDIIIVEIGGTVGDIESIPYLESARQFSRDFKEKKVLYIHVTLIPKITAADEWKTKPTQHSVQKLREIGIQPDILLCRIDGRMDESMKSKLALFTNVDNDAVIEAINTERTIYEVPLSYEERNLADVILRKFGLKSNVCDLSKWEKLIKHVKNPKWNVKIALVGQYTELQDAHKSLTEALNHGIYENDANLELVKISGSKINKSNIKELLHGVDGILIPGGFGSDGGIDGIIDTIEYARVNNIPLLAIGLGMQLLTIEFVRNVVNIKEATSIEFDNNAKEPLFIPNKFNSEKVVKNKFRLGKFISNLKHNSLFSKIYKTDKISERHRHMYEFNNKYKDKIEEKGLLAAAINEDNNNTDNSGLVNGVELKGNRFHIGVQFHPEFKSKPFSPHPLFVSFVKEALNK